MLGGLDIGTTGCKFVVFDDKGNQLYSSYKNYPTNHANGRHETDILSILDGVKYVIKDCLTKYPDVEGFAIDSFGESFVLLDKDDKPLTSVISPTDSRGEVEIKHLLDVLGEQRVRDITGVKPATLYSYGKLIWCKKEMPDIFTKAAHICLMEDAVIYLLTGKNYIDYSLATRSMMFDYNKLCWSKEILNVENIDENVLSKPVPLGTVCGLLKDSIMKELGISKSPIVVAGGHDQVAVALGSGVIEPNTATEGAGTCACMGAVFDNSLDKNSFIENNYCIIPYLDNYITYAFVLTSGSLIHWFSKTIVSDNDNDIFQKLESEFIDKPTGILVLPHFAGSATPYMDNSSKGAFIGLTLGTSKGVMYQAILEGISYELKTNLQCLAKSNVNIKQLIASGGGSNSSKWMQMQANILNLPIKKLSDKECGARGCAMITAIALNKFKDLKDILPVFIKYTDEFVPNPAMVEQYSKEYERYTKVYDFVKGVIHE